MNSFQLGDSKTLTFRLPPVKECGRHAGDGPGRRRGLIMVGELMGIWFCAGRGSGELSSLSPWLNRRGSLS